MPGENCRNTGICSGWVERDFREEYVPDLEGMRIFSQNFLLLGLGGLCETWLTCLSKKHTNWMCTILLSLIGIAGILEV